MNAARTSGTSAECYAHAMAVEREAAARCHEFADLMAWRGEEAIADLFERLARDDEEAAAALEHRAARTALPKVPPTAHSWVDDAPAEHVSHEPLHLLSAHDTILIALDNARRARAFFDSLVEIGADADARSIASQMAAENAGRIRCLEQALAKTPRPLRIGEELIGLMH
jgi:hypothetical protein